MASLKTNKVIIIIWSNIVLFSCSNRPPILDPIVPQKANVGAMLEIPLMGNDPDGDNLTYGFTNLTPRQSKAVIADTSEGPVFQWTPTAYDQGPHFPMFYATDGEDYAYQKAEITVTGLTSTDDYLPVFIWPANENIIWDVHLTEQIIYIKVSYVASINLQVLYSESDCTGKANICKNIKNNRQKPTADCPICYILECTNITQEQLEANKLDGFQLTLIAQATDIPEIKSTKTLNIIFR